MGARNQSHSDRTGVCVYAPSTIVTVTVETGDRGQGGDELHLHAGGQGFWIARLLGRLGVPTTLCSVFGGETGQVALALARAEPIDVRAVEGSSPNGAWVHDRRAGEREIVADIPDRPLSRHAADELYGATLTTAFENGVCVLAGPHGAEIAPADHYRRLAKDLRENGVVVIADLSGPELAAALDGGVDFCKVSDEDLDPAEASDAPGSAPVAVRALQRAGASNAAVTRGARPLVAAIGDELVEAHTPPLQTEDHRGAGDAFTALVAATQHWGLDWREGVRWGAAAGSLTVLRRGLATADRREIHRLLDRIELRRVDVATGAGS